MTGFKKIVTRAPYKERAQPSSRQKLGLLEKHKDYTLRARDYARKKARLAKLQVQAEMRNPDEFYHAMLSRSGPGTALTRGKQWDGTVASTRSKGTGPLSMDVVRLLKTQDLKYIQTVRNVAAKDVARLREKVVEAEAMLRVGKGGVVVDKEDEEEEVDDDDEDDETSWRKQGKKVKSSSKSIPQSAAVKHNSRPKKIIFADDVAERDAVVAAGGVLPRQGPLDSHDGLSNCITDDDKEATEQLKTRLQSRPEHLIKLKKRLERAEEKLAILDDTEHRMEVQQAGMAKTATTGVVTKKGKLLKSFVRKR